VIPRRLRVLFLATRDWYNPATTGGDNTLWENARYLASVGHSVTYVAGAFTGAPAFQEVDGISVVRLGGIHSLWLRTFVFYMRYGRGKYDVVVSEGFGGSRIPRLAPLYVREPIITSWHQVHRELFAAQYPRVLNAPLNTLERVTAWVHRNTWVQAYTEEGRQAFPALGFRPDRVFVVPVSIRDEWLSESNGHKSNTPTILWIGKFRRYKCPDHAIRAMADVVKHVPRARLVLVGRHDDASYERELTQLVTQFGLDDNVEFRFNVTENEKRGLLTEARLLVLPSAIEGFGIVVLEANACGVPVIASSGVPGGAVAEGQNGLRYDFGDTRRLLIVQALQSDALYADLSRNSMRSVREFAWSLVGARFERVVSGLVSPSLS
jgi:glycosyltransferase involved in cell wall biosynthesis